MRQSGRTTMMLQAANTAQGWGHVLIIVPNRGMEQHCRSLAGKHGISFHRVDFATVTQVTGGKYRGFRGSIFEDHTTWETISDTTKSALMQEISLMKTNWSEPSSVDPDEQERQELREQLRQSQAVSN